MTQQHQNVSGNSNDEKIDPVIVTQSRSGAVITSNTSPPLRPTPHAFSQSRLIERSLNENTSIQQQTQSLNYQIIPTEKQSESLESNPKVEQDLAAAEKFITESCSSSQGNMRTRRKAFHKQTADHPTQSQSRENLHKENTEQTQSVNQSQRIMTPITSNQMFHSQEGPSTQQQFQYQQSMNDQMNPHTGSIPQNRPTQMIYPPQMNPHIHPHQANAWYQMPLYGYAPYCPQPMSNHSHQNNIPHESHPHQETSSRVRNNIPSSFPSVDPLPTQHFSMLNLNPTPTVQTPVYPVVAEVWATYMNNIVEFSDGRGRDAMRFLKSFNEVVAMFSTASDATIVYWFGAKLSGFARIWFDSVKNESGENLTWLKMKEKFMLMYGKGKRKEFDILLDLRETKQNVVAGEGVRHYVIRLQDLFSEYYLQTGSQLKEKEKCDYFIGGLMARLRPLLVTLKAARGNATLTELIKEAYKLESTLRQTDAEIDDAVEKLRFDSDDDDEVSFIRAINAAKGASELENVSNKQTVDKSKEKPKSDSKNAKEVSHTKGLPNLIETLRQSREKQEAFNRTIENKLEKQELVSRTMENSLKNSIEDNNLKYESLQKAILNLKDHYRPLIVQKEMNKVTPERVDNKTNNYNQNSHSNNYQNRHGYIQAAPRSSEEVRTSRTQDGKIAKCYFCREPGHFKQECQKYNRWVTVSGNIGKFKRNDQHSNNSNLQNSDDSDQSNSNITGNQTVPVGKVQSISSRLTEYIQTISEHIENNDSDTEECLEDESQVEALDSMYEYITGHLSREEIENRSKTINSISNTNYGGVKRFARDLLTARGTVAGVQVEAIFDSGAVTTCMSFDFFKKLPYEVKIKLDKSVKLPCLTAATGQAMNLVGELKNDLQFKDDQGGHVVFREVPFVITKDLTNSILIGSNLLGNHCFSGYTVDFTKRTLSFRHREEDKSTTILMISSEFEDTRADGKCPVQVLRDVTVPSNSMMFVPEKALMRNYSKLKNQIKTELEGKALLFEPENNQFRLGVYIRPALVQITLEDPTVPILLINETNPTYLVRAGTVVGSCESASNKVEGWGFQRKHIYSVMEEHSTIREGPTINSNSVEQFEGLKAGLISPELMEELKRLLIRYKILFEDRPFGSNAVGLTEHSIELIDPRCKPVKQYAYKVSPALGKKQKEFVNGMIKRGIIKVSEGSPWASPVVCVPKADGTLRFCTDFRRLNALTQADVFPIPRLDDVTDRMLGCKWFSKFDLKDAFHQVPVKVEDQQKTAFICQGQLYEYLKMPFGLKNSPACFQRNIQNVIGDCEYAMPYLDDIIVHSRTEEEHIGHLASVLEKMSRYRLHCKLVKCEFFQPKVKYLGLIFSQEGIAVDQEKVSGIVRMLPPTTLTELRSFLGMCNFYRKFIKDFSTIAAPMTHLTHKDVVWDFDEACNQAFNLLKQSLIKAPILVCPNFDKKFILTTDASNWAIGAVLSQEDDNNVERPICFLSRKLNDHEINYATTHKECLSVVWSIEELRHYLQGHKFLIRTDHLALKYLMTTKDLQGRLARWALKIMEYDFDIDYIKGKDNKVADALSRVPINQIREQPMIAEKTLEERLKEIKKLQEEDQTLRPLMLYLITGEAPEHLTNSSTFFMESKNYVMDNGVLYHLHHQVNVRK